MHISGTSCANDPAINLNAQKQIVAELLSRAAKSAAVLPAFCRDLWCRDYSSINIFYTSR